MNVLVLKTSPEETDILTFFLESQFHAKVIVVATAQDAMNSILDETGISLVLCEDGDQLVKIAKFLASMGEKIPAILLKQADSLVSSGFPEVFMGTVPISNSLDLLKTLIQKGIDEGVIKSESEKTEYCRIKTPLLLRVAPLKGDVFIRLSSVKYVKLFNQGDSFDAKDVEKYLGNKKIEYLYLRNSDAAEFVSKLQADLEKLLQSPQTTPEQAERVARQVQEAVQELGLTLGFTPEVQAIAKQGVDIAVKSIGKSPRLSKVFEILQKDGGNYLSAHSMALAHVSCSLSLALEWPSSTTFQKLTFAAFFHDITLSNQDLARVSSLFELAEKAAKFTDVEIQSFKNHPITVAELIRRFNEVPSDVDTIVIQHHELPDGSGFPRGIMASHIMPLSSVFIVAHDYIDFLYANPKATFHEFLTIHKEKYIGGSFRKIAESLIRSTKLNLP